jgi:hypothetical protein
MTSTSSERTPGEAARERLLAAQLRRDPDVTATPWGDLPQDYRDDWEDIAQAAIGAAQRLERRREDTRP